MLEALKRASVTLSDTHKISYAEQAERLRVDFGWHIRDENLYRAVKGKTNISTRKDGLADALYDYFIGNHE